MGIYHALGNMNGTGVPSGKAGGVGDCSKEAKALLLKLLSDGAKALEAAWHVHSVVPLHEVSGARVRTYLACGAGP